MAAIENLEIVVDVDIADALASLESLQGELEDLADEINRLDARGTEGIDIDVELHGGDAELAALRAKIEAFEQSTDVDLDTDIDGGLLGAGAPFPDEMVDIGGRDRDLRTPDVGIGGVSSVGRGLDGLEFDFDRQGRFSKMMESMSDSIAGSLDSLKGFNLRMSDLHNALARLVPLLLLFIGVIPAAITALVGLAAAAVAALASLAAIAGLGALGVALVDGQFDMQRLTDVLEDVKDSFIEAFAPLAERLQPVFMDAVGGLEMFFQAVAAQGDALMALTDEARAFGQFLIDFVPGALRVLAGLVEAMAPQFAAIGDFLSNNFANIVRTLVSLTAEAIPIIAQLALRVGGMLPALVRMSIGMAMVADVVLRAIGALGRFLDLLGISPKILGLVIGGILVAISALLLFNSSLLATAFNGLVKFGAMLLGTIGKLLGYSAANVIATLATWGLYEALLALLSLTVIGLVLVGISTAVSTMGSRFASASSDVDALTKSLKDFDRVSSGMSNDGFNPYGAGSGAAAADVPGGGTGRGGGGTVINIESSGNRQDDKSNAKYAVWREGRTTGGNN